MLRGGVISLREPWNWCRKEDSNLRPIAYEATALPTELFRHVWETKLYRKKLSRVRSHLTVQASRAAC